MGAQLPPGGEAAAEPAGHRAQLCPVLIGRADLLALAHRRLTAAAAGTGQLLFLSGEAGIGKTRLLTEIIRQANTLGFQAVGAGAFPRDAEVAGGLLNDLAADMQRAPSSATAGRQISRCLAAMYSDDQGRSGDAHRQRRMLVSDLAEALTSLGPDPVLIALEDLHWADDTTLEVLDRIAGRLSALPILLVGTYRSDELYPRLPVRSWRSRLLNQRWAEEVRLTRLGPDDTAAMAAAISGTVLSSETTGAVFARSDGIPLHVEEFLATLQIADGAADSIVEVPDTLADAVLARADLLTAAARELAAAASVIGRSFDVDLLAAITDESPAAIDAGLRELTDRFLVAPRGAQAGGQAAGRPPAAAPITYEAPSYDFRHALIRDALYSDLAPYRRRDLHARAAEAAAASGFSDAFVSDQFERANRPVAAHRRALAGAADAVAISAHREAVELYRRAQRTSPRDASAAERAELLTALANELAAIDDNVASADAFEQAFSLLRGLGSDVGAAALVPPLVAVQHLLGVGLTERATRLRAALALISSLHGDAVLQTRGQLYAALSAAYMLDRRLDEAIEVAERATAAKSQENAPTIGIPGDLVTGCNLDATLGAVLVFAGRMDEGWRLLADSIARATDARLEAEAARGYRMLATSASVLVEYERALTWLRAGVAYAERTERFNDRHYMASHLAHVHWAVGDWTVAEPLARQALADCGDGVTTRITALHVLGFLALGRGETIDAQRHLTEAAELGSQVNELQRIAPAWWGLAETALLVGRPQESIRRCEQGYLASAEVQDAAYLFPFLVTGARAHLTLGDISGARDWVGRCGQLLLRRNIPGTLGALTHAKGLLQLHDGQTGRARESLAGASLFWDERRRFWEGTQVLLDRARCATRSRRPAEAAELAGRARARGLAAGARPLVQAAEAHLSGTAATEPSPLLTAREVEIAGLVASGATNREIAGALFIAPKTVAAHVEHILSKLGAARRTQIASWVASRPAARPQGGDRSER